MKYIKILLKILLFLFLLTIIISFVIENIVVNTFSQEILSKRVSGYLLDEIIHDVDINELELIENNIRNSKSTKKITAEFINTLIQNIINDRNTKINIENEVDILISKYMPNEISDEKLQNMRKNVIEQVTNTEERLQNNLLYGFGENYLIILKIYNVVTNIYFRIIIAILCVTNIAILCILEKYRTLKSIRNISIIITIIMLIILILIELLSNFIDQRLAGGWLQDINTNALILSITIGSVVSALLILISKNGKAKGKEEKIETKENSNFFIIFF